MNRVDLSFDADRAVERLMRFLAVEGVTGRERAIARRWKRRCGRLGVPASAIRFDDANERIPVPTADRQSDRETAGHAPERQTRCCSDPPRHRAAVRGGGAGAVEDRIVGHRETRRWAATTARAWPVLVTLVATLLRAATYRIRR